MDSRSKIRAAIDRAFFFLGTAAGAAVGSGNPTDKSLCLPVINTSINDYGQVPLETVANGGYASHNNVAQGRGIGVDRVVFNKRCGLGFHDMGVKKKTQFLLSLDAH